MQKYSTPAIVPGGGRDALSVETQADAVFGSVDVYLASDVHARIAELERELQHVTRQRDETAEKLTAANERIQALTFGDNRSLMER